MKNFAKGLLLGGAIGVIIGVLIVVGFKIKDKNEKITIERTITQSEDGDILTELSDGSFIIINEEKNIYEFQPVDLGDWSYELSSKTELDKIVQTYISIKNNGSF